MKIKYRISIVFFFFVFFSFSQEAKKESQLSIGIHAAPAGAMYWNTHVLKRDFGIQYQPKLGFIAGFSAQYDIKPEFAVSAEVNYERKGCMIVLPGLTDSNGVLIGTGRERDHWDYLTLPIMAKFKRNKEKMSLYVNAGIYVGYLIDYGWYLFPLQNFAGEKVKGNVNSVHRLDYGIVAGLGCNIPIKEHFQFSMEVRNNLGVSSITKGKTYNNQHLHNESFALLFGLAYKI